MQILGAQFSLDLMRTALTFSVAAALVGCAAMPPTEAEVDHLAKAANESRKTGICNIHHIRMQKKLVPKEYAHLPIEFFSSDYHYAELRGFPNAREYALTLFPDDQGKRMSLYVCAECQRAEREWIASHPHDEWGKTLGPKKI
jgi:hypothetical protein